MSWIIAQFAWDYDHDRNKILVTSNDVNDANETFLFASLRVSNIGMKMSQKLVASYPHRHSGHGEIPCAPCGLLGNRGAVDDNDKKRFY